MRPLRAGQSSKHRKSLRPCTFLRYCMMNDYHNFVEGDSGVVSGTPAAEIC
jgi:hypothetical protein